MEKIGHKLRSVQSESLDLEKLQKFTWIGLWETTCLESKTIFKSMFWKRMEDDVVLIWKKGAADLYRQMSSDDLYRFLLKLNGYENSKQLTLH